MLLGIGALVLSRMLGGSWPREQKLLFRLPVEHADVASELSVSFTRVGESEPARGFSLTLNPPTPRELHKSVSLPNGEYIVALQLTYHDTAGPSAP